ncbi:hypothetical protein MYP_1545 [Sporocytophaga myxococcoides]|uniref:Uncharacterized protein n=1 Tax=Sporocytophaga myxococcoides TaxID=153721 RepID=A0A098LD37_9BACT|nr:hypothetical protein [Sporocytophaga myxococcoides]GAL84317.1 hypothetical protein MYP_1545 [Sporocytophaga myxococcoides]
MEDKFNCTCTHSISIRKNVTVSIACPFCRNLYCLVNDEIIKTSTLKPIMEDVSPLKINGEGILESKEFRITGRQQIIYHSSYKNLWSATYKSGEHFQIGESYGTYSIIKEVSAQVSPNKFRNLKVGKEIELAPKHSFYVNGIHEMKELTAEGDFPMPIILQTRCLSIELSNNKFEFAIINIYGDNDLKISSGYFLNFEDFSFKNIRNLNGWI